jgi:hypothetical protein
MSIAAWTIESLEALPGISTFFAGVSTRCAKWLKFIALGFVQD